WRNTFVLFGGVGLVWAFLFYSAFREPDGRARHSVRATAQSATENGAHGVTRPTSADSPQIPWRSLLTSRTVWLLWLQYFCVTYGWFFYVTWLPTYLKETRGLQLDQNALMLWLGNLLGQTFTAETTQKILVAALAGIPLFFGGVGAILCGMI